MSIFTKDVTCSDEMKKAISEALKSQTVVTEENVHIPGYGIVSRERAQKEAHSSSQLAHEHAASGNHNHAAIQYERAAMFHKALYNHAMKTHPEAKHGFIPPNPLKEETVVESVSVRTHQLPTGEKAVTVDHAQGSVSIGPEHVKALAALPQGSVYEFADGEGETWLASKADHFIHLQNNRAPSPPGEESKAAMTLKFGSEYVCESSNQPKETDVARVAAKYHRNQARDMKRKDKEKSERKHDDAKYQ